MVLVASCATLSHSPREYRLRVVAGVASDEPEFVKLHETMVDERIRLGDSLKIGTAKSKAQVVGVLTEMHDGRLHFKGRIRVYSTSAHIDTDMTLGKPFSPKSVMFSSMIHVFFVEIQKI